MNRFQHIIDRLLQLCDDCMSLHAVIIIGSQARSEHQADEFSDLDLILVCDAPEQLLYQNEFVCQLGKIEYSFLENTLANQKERRILYEGSLDVDFIPVTTECFYDSLESHAIDEILGRGYQVVYDKIGVSDRLKTVSFSSQAKNSAFSEAEFSNLVNDFYYHAVWAKKKVLRGELWTAKMCVDCYLKNRLLQVIELYEKQIHGSDFDTWHNGRMLEQWAEADIIQELSRCFAHYDAEDILNALDRTVALFTRLSHQLVGDDAPGRGGPTAATRSDF